MALAAHGNPLDDRSIRQIVTPEGVALHVRLAERSSRFMALIIDLVVIGFTLTLLAVFLFLVAGEYLTFGWLIAFLLLASFLLRSPYFMYFEMRWRGKTPGKRVMHIRVIDRYGGPLTAEAVVARNLMREVEVFLPITVVLAPAAYQAAGWFGIMCIVWTVLVLVMVLLHRDGMRIGDLIAGTWVIEDERQVLQSDLTHAARASSSQPTYRFTETELDAYGIHELQVLEDILRKTDQRHDPGIIADVSMRIRRKIGWNVATPFNDDMRFLQDYYAGLRGRLEQGLLYGKRRETKHDRAVFDTRKKRR
jgi:uncharacterized RDD family membrane protein YckC